MKEGRGAQAADRREGERRKEPGSKLPPEEERRKAERRGGDGETKAGA
jgi:hypothetical protein